MAPDAALNLRSLARKAFFGAITLTVFSFALFLPLAEAVPVVQNLKTPGYCMAESGGTVYFSPFYDTKLNMPARMSSNFINREFVEYLKGRYEFKPQGNFPASCQYFGKMSDAQASKLNLETRARQENKQIVAVEWNFVMDADMVAASYTDMGEDVVAVVAGKRKPTHTYCVSETSQGTLYTAGPVDTGMSVNLSLWNRGFDQLLTQKYSYKGPVYCNIGSPQEITRLLAARVAGARAASRQVVDTAWKYDPSVVATANPAPAKRDDDPEPAQRPVAPNPSRQARDLAAKEMPDSVAFCTKDMALSTVFNCDRFARVVYNYRVAHANEPPEPVANLVARHKLNCAECIDNTRVSLWVSNRANADGLENRVTNCVTQKVIVTLYKTPDPARLREFYKDAVTACK
jgi:hypothetical protein